VFFYPQVVGGLSWGQEGPFGARATAAAARLNGLGSAVRRRGWGTVNP
jgi:hypothetical protein